MKQLIRLSMLLIAAGAWTIAQGQNADTSQEMIKVYVKQDPATYNKEKSDQALVLEYAVQLSASSRPILDQNSLNAWEELGPLYIHQENGMYKVRIGPFDNQEKAKSVLLHAKQRGKMDAFIVVQKGLESYTQPDGYQRQEAFENEFDPIMPKNQMVAVTPNPTSHTVAPTSTAAPAVITSPAVAEIAAPTSNEEVKVEDIEYKVRLVSFLKPGGFSTKDVDQYGPLESYRKGEWTIMMIGGFKTEQAAIKVRDEVIAKGYKDAGVVEVRDGMLQLDH